MSKHTVAPWLIGMGADGQPIIHEPATDRCSGQGIAHVCKQPLFSNATAEANARLIAAAPLMYEALTKLIDKFYEVAERHNDRSCDYDVCEEVRLTRAAIAAVEGK